MVALAHIPPNGDLEIVHILMEAGADTNQGILLSQLRALHRLQPRKVLQSLSTAAPESGYIRILPLDLACAVGNKSAVLLLLQRYLFPSNATKCLMHVAWEIVWILQVSFKADFVYWLNNMIP